MGKALSTKRTILDMLSSREKTTTEVSRETGLAKSTISQHLKELQQMGAIEIVDNPYIRKWKYYRKVEGFEFGGERVVMRIRIPEPRLDAERFRDDLLVGYNRR